MKWLEKHTGYKNQIGPHSVFNEAQKKRSSLEVNGCYKHSQFIIECGILEKHGYKNYLLIILLTQQTSLSVQSFFFFVSLPDKHQRNKCFYKILFVESVQKIYLINPQPLNQLSKKTAVNSDNCLINLMIYFSYHDLSHTFLHWI